MKRRLIALILAAVGSAGLLSAQPRQDPETLYRETANRIIGAAMSDAEGWERLTYLCDRIGHRISGSRSLEQAVRWSAAEMRKAGLRNVRVPSVMVPNWVRGSEEARIVSPIQRDLAVLGLGSSVGTPPEGIEAEVVVVTSFEELETLGREAVEGKIVLYDVPWQGYGRTVRYRSKGATNAARLGAIASLVRSVGPISLQTPHTGQQRYGEGVARIPAAALTIEGASLIHRLSESGQTVRVRLTMGAKTLPDAPSANVIGEIPGRESPHEIVVMGGHLDSWDVGQGAHDDGAGVIASLQAAALIRKLGLRPRRTIRVVFWTAEENGIHGGRAYFEWAGDSVAQHVAAIEMDGGSERPIGFGMSHSAGDASQAKAMQPIARLLDPIGAGTISWGGGGADIGPLMREGVPGFGLRTVGEKYFHWHHTRADTIDKIDKDDFRRNVAALAILSYVLADMPEKLVDFLNAE